MPPRRATSARKPPSAPRRPRREIRTFEEAAQVINDLRPKWPCAIHVVCSYSLFHDDDSRSMRTTYTAWCFPHGSENSDLTIKASSPQDLVRKVIEDIFPRLAPQGLPMRPPKPTPSTVVDPAVRPLPGQRTLCLPGPGG